jgi:DNA gyrase inhibitor GyrI
MAHLSVDIVELPPLRVASFHGFGAEPEHAAWQKLKGWAPANAYLANPDEHPIFGFNNPSPSPGSPNYGYEFWMVVGPEEEPHGDMTIKQFEGGLYAVTRCEVKNAPYDTIPATWKQLIAWREASNYRSANHQWLEKHIRIGDLLSEDFDLDLYLPVAR